jgi:hypothetical protein
VTNENLLIAITELNYGTQDVKTMKVLDSFIRTAMWIGNNFFQLNCEWLYYPERPGVIKYLYFRNMYINKCPPLRRRGSESENRQSRERPDKASRKNGRNERRRRVNQLMQQDQQVWTLDGHSVDTNMTVSSWILLRGTQLTLVQCYWGSIVKMVFSYKILMRPIHLWRSRTPYGVRGAHFPCVITTIMDQKVQLLKPLN